MMSVAQELRADLSIALMIAIQLTVAILRMLVFAVITHVSKNKCMHADSIEWYTV